MNKYTEAIAGFVAEAKRQIEEKQAAIDAVKASNERRRQQIIREYLPHARPGNFAWRKIEELQGFEGDYQPSDEGMHWSDNKEE